MTDCLLTKHSDSETNTIQFKWEVKVPNGDVFHTQGCIGVADVVKGTDPLQYMYDTLVFDYTHLYLGKYRCPTNPMHKPKKEKVVLQLVRKPR